MTLRNRLLSILAVPLAVILASTAVEVVRQGRHLATLGDTARSVRLATGIGGLVHELQKERGLSAGFLASGGAQFGPELAAQRQAADAREQALRATLPPGGAGLPQDLRTALHHLEGRPALRQQVDGKQVKVRQAFTDFTEDIDALLDSADELARGADDADLVRRASAYLALLRAKEQVGRERATLNAVFAADRFDAEAYRRLLTILSAQEVHLASFLAQAGEAAHQAYQAALGGGQFDEAASLRKLALDRSEQGGFGVEPRRWFAAVTARIEAFKTVEDGLVADLEASLEAGRAAAWRGLLLYALVLAVGAGAAVALALRMVRIVLRQVGGEPDEVCRLAGALAEGNLHQDTGAPAPRGSVLEATQLLVARLGTVLSQVRGALDGLASGDLPPPLAEPFPGDLDVMRERLNACIATLRGLEADTTSLAEAAVVGRLEVRADAARHGGAYRRIVEGVNQTIGTLVGHLDAIPAPALIIDPDRKVRYLNAAGRALVGNKTAEEVIGQPCGGLLRTGDCTEERCVCLAAMRTGHTEVSETPGRPGDQVVELRHAGVPMRDGRGRVTGAFEVFADQTDVKRAAERAGKVAAYQAAEAQRLVGALQAFSRGDFSRRVEVAEGDQDTAEVVATYRQISAALASSAAAVQALVADLRALAAAGVAGQLKERVPAVRHQGDFRAVAEGVNRTLDAALAPVDEAAGILERLAARDLTVRVAGEYAGDHDRIKAAVNQTAGALQDALRQVAEAAAQVSDASSQIASSSQAVASGASTQAASIQETGRSLEAVSQVSGANAQRAARASGLAGEAAGAARQGAVTVEKAQATMARMRASAEGTAQIIRDINGIAFQTNLLALNAAVEAARAGDAGRGFAVVAEEVRSLAARSREAAAKTEALIQDSVRSAEEGEAVTRELAASFAGISAGVQAVTGIVREISETAREEAGGLGRVSGAVEDMDRVTQQNAASAEQSSSAAAQLSAQAEELAGMVASFRLEAGGGRA